MHPIFLYITGFILVGGIGMSFANRRVHARTGQQRWLKFLTYIVIVNSVIISMLIDRFYILAILIAVAGLWEVTKILSQPLARSFQGVVIAIYILVATGFVYFSAFFGQSFLLFIYFQVVIFDGFCQVIGQLLGRRKLLPKISPGKTVEGLIGGTLFSLVAAILARDWIDCSMPEAITIGLITILFAFGGDLLASYLKRCCRVKDYSNLLPGHGGFLDRFDSLMMAGIGCLLIFLQP